MLGPSLDVRIRHLKNVPLLKEDTCMTNYNGHRPHNIQMKQKDITKTPFGKYFSVVRVKVVYKVIKVVQLYIF